MAKKKLPKTSFKRILSNILFVTKIAMKESPLYTLELLLGGAFHSVIVFFEHVFMIGYIVNAITQGKPFREVFWFVLLIFIGVVITANLRGVLMAQYIKPVSEQKINRRIRMELYKKAAEMDLSCYDDPEFYNDFIWATNDAPKRVYDTLGSVSSMIGAIVNLILAGGYTISNDKFGIPIILLSFFGIFVVNTIRNKMQVRKEEEIRPFWRKAEYTSRVMYLADYAKELRLNNIKDRLYDRYNKATADIEEVVKKRSGGLMVVNVLASFVFSELLISGVYLLYLLYRAVVLKNLAYGTLIVIYRSCSQIRGSLFSSSRTVTSLHEQSLYIDKIRTFLEYENKVVSPKKPLPLPKTVDEISFKNVSFAYGDKQVLKNVDMTIKKGQKIAIVGYNGAGKTTFVKLLMRLYDAGGGEICYNGKNINEYDVKEYRDIFETVFQDYQIFAATVGENICASNSGFDKNRAETAVKNGGFASKLAKLEKGYEAVLTNEFDDDGIQLSGGEAQSLVISRAFYKDSPVIILDEPSSALDPLAEYKLNESMYKLSGDKTVITISHRLSTTKSADLIYMFDDGEIIEQGTHEELMDKDGAYAHMFNLQAEKYNIPYEDVI